MLRARVAGESAAPSSRSDATPKAAAGKKQGKKRTAYELKRGSVLPEGVEEAAINTLLAKRVEAKTKRVRERERERAEGEETLSRSLGKKLLLDCRRRLFRRISRLPTRSRLSSSQPTLVSISTTAAACGPSAAPAESRGFDLGGGPSAHSLRQRMGIWIGGMRDNGTGSALARKSGPFRCES